MGTIGARKLRQVIENVRNVLGIEYLAACQALDLQEAAGLSPLSEPAYQLLRQTVPMLQEDRIMYPDIRQAAALLADGALLQAVIGEEEPLLPVLPCC
jgi:histidine ammonia-lyase